MIFINKEYLGLRITMKSATQSIGKNGERITEQGKYIQFTNGQYETNDEKEIAFLKEYMKKHQGEIVILKNRPK